MHRLSICPTCAYHAQSPYLICTLHPTGQPLGYCPDYEAQDERPLEQDWTPDGAHYDGDDLVVDTVDAWQQEQRLFLLDWHPLFTGRCPECEHPIPGPIHYDCDHCGWKDDTC